MEDEANNRSVIVYDLATQAVSIKKIGDLGKFDVSFSIFSHKKLTFRRNKPNIDSANPQIEDPCGYYDR